MDRSLFKVVLNVVRKNCKNSSR